MLYSCFTAMQHWLDINGLSMNSDETEAMAVGIPGSQRRPALMASLVMLTSAKSILTTSHGVRSLGVINS